MQQQIILWANDHALLICIIIAPLLVLECWWFVRVFREYLKSAKEISEASKERRRQFSLSMFRLWTSIKQSEEWNIDTTESKEVYSSILQGRKEAGQLDTLFFCATAPSILGILICCFTAWINILVFEISFAFWAITVVWLIIGLTWYLIRRRAFKAKYALS